MSLTITEALAGRLEGYEERKGQDEMASGVRQTLTAGGMLIVEAGTGTGKSLAYLIPLIEHAMETERRAVVSTYTKALQRQLFEKDIPFLKQHLFPTVQVALCVGGENYLCLRRLGQAKTYGLFEGAPAETDKLIEWAATTKDGIREGSGGILWGTVSREGDMCFGRDCGYFNRCFYQRAKDYERKSNILLTNHHLYFANHASGGKALPEFNAAVFDEAHELEDVAAEYLSTDISDIRLRYLLNSVLGPRGRGVLGRLKWLSQSNFSYMSSILGTVKKAGEDFFRSVSEQVMGNTLRIRNKDFVDDCLSEPLMRLYKELDGLREAAPDDDEKRELLAVAQRAQAASEAVSAVISQSLGNHVYWAQKTPRIIRVAATPIEIACMKVFAPLSSAIFTSATLSAGGDFGYIEERLGIAGAKTLLLPSPFDYKNNALLYIGRDLPEPNRQGFEHGVTRRVAEILNITRGQTLVLFTSHSMLSHVADGVEADGVDILKQGDADSYQLLKDFRTNRHAALLGTYTFWQGVDVPGDALSCVVITRLPFSVPDEPVVQARIERLIAEGRDPFTHYQVPEAAILFKQGFGRLIRTATDRGVVAVLDSRLINRGYGKIFIKSLPECTISYKVEDIGKFLVKKEGTDGA